jgi:hypothetical protein
MLFLLVESCLALIAIAVAFVFPNLGASWFERLEKLFGRLARRRGLSVLVVGLAALAVRAAVLPVLPIPQPGIQDEFSYLLAADTFAHGRLTNPPHPMWIHFETFQVIQQPTYASKYPPAQGLILAVGQVVFGHPFWGVWLSVGLMCAALCWMLQGLVPQKWALLGGFLAVIRLAAFSYWANSYWGGAVAATGGALLVGALPRIKQEQRVRDALLMGVGLAILANSRPYEGLVCSLPVAVALLVWILRKDRPSLKLAARRVVVPLGLVLAITAGAMLYYFWRTTGTPFRMPYQVYTDTYDPTPYLVWQTPRPHPTYHHAVMRDLYTDWELSRFTGIRSLSGYVSATLVKMNVLWLFYVGPLFVLTVLIAAATAPYGLSWRQINPDRRFLLIATGVAFVGFTFDAFYLPHYAAPMTCLIYGLVLVAARHLARWQWRGKPSGLAAVRTISATCVVLLLLRAAAPILHIPVPPTWVHTWWSEDFQLLDRTRVLDQLKGYPGRHLVIVHYQPEHDLSREWVYNEADIESAKVILAREMSPAENEELTRYFNHRRVWLVEPDETPPRLSPYPSINNANDAIKRGAVSFSER